jgi:hypothetical protein
MQSVTFVLHLCIYAECYAECHYSDGSMLTGIMLAVVMLSVVMLIVITLSDIVLSFTMPSILECHYI